MIEERQDNENTNDDQLPPIPDSILNKYHIEPNLAKYDIEQTSPSQNKSTKVMYLRSSQRKLDQFWQAFIYLECKPTRGDRQFLSQIISTTNNNAKLHTSMTNNGTALKFSPLYRSKLGSPQNLHVTLTPNIPFASEALRDSMLQVLSDKINKCKIRPFVLEFESARACKLLRSVVNDKLFLALDVKEEIKRNQLMEIHEIIDETLKKVIPEYYSQSWKNRAKDFYLNNAHMSLAESNTVPSRMVKDFKKLQDLLSYNNNPKNCNDGDKETIQEENNLSFQIRTLKVDIDRQTLTIPFIPL
ncbi:phosphoric diester hydrolase NDAI_0G02550 [Naumovozyma dairenensis CBS 421]|uniref:U6 snRNA phosphodiesterase 1 n=1 Tax=Naumovozyma dairenensis (strain ATCC 10597 / BCRC 20456 / CBS 421 / NBRC 0211 / NRRL Y-12639) TaxID=1071378 RepID=G0WE21_NAUDC|nr:hypothetical protein NDAI_0G02550 [Naumovozyma dairenensis CBS 421]CCD26032.2 hypothetical protein NDAI_0G02550 [Naumovozyma dairenensis CBS 421]